VISKRIDRMKKTSDFDRLGRYVLEARNDSAAILWTRTAEYVVDLSGEGEKVLWFRMSNCEAEIPAMAIAEVLATQAENTRSQVDKTYHCVISFPEGEKPTRAQLEDIEDRLCEALGFGEHQRISAVHQDTDNIHLHLAINKVHPQTFNIQEPYRDYFIRDKICRELELKHGLTVDNGIGQGQRYGKAKELEAHTGEQSLLSWIQEQVKPALMDAVQSGDSWEPLHLTLAEHGLLIKLRGAGLVITLADGSMGVKASSVDKALAFKSLTDRWGEYQPPIGLAKVQNQNTADEIPPKVVYQKGPRQNDEAAKKLYEDFQSTKLAANQTRTQLKAQLNQEKVGFNQNLKTWHAQERLKIKHASLSPQQKRAAYQQLAQARQVAWKNQREKEATQKKSVHSTHGVFTWEQFLIKQAEQGNSKALELLRYRKARQAKMETAFLTAENLAAARHIVYEDLKPLVRKNGDLIYQVKDGGSVTDEKHLVCVSTQTAGSTFLALTMASERFQDQPLDVQGSADFKRQVIQLAVQYELGVTFKDPALEQERQHLSQTQKKHQVPEGQLSPALQAYLSQRNAMRERVGNLKVHRVWTAQDAGIVTYQGRRNLTSGAQVVLLETQEAMLVKPVHSEKEFHGLKVGQSIQVDGQGYMVGQSKGRGR
jgi:hypothetical protein